MTAARYVHIFITFALSETMHKLVDSTAGISPSENLGYEIITMQVVGITLEDLQNGHIAQQSWVDHRRDRMTR